MRSTTECGGPALRRRSQGGAVARARAWSQPFRDGLAALALLLCGLTAMAAEDTADLLRRADSIKTSNPSEFRTIVESLEKDLPALSNLQRDHLQYLRAWQTAYDGDSGSAITALQSLADTTTDPVQRFRARGTIANLQALASRYDSAFIELSQLLPDLPEIDDVDAREQVLGVAAQLYNQVGEYDLAIDYADKLIAQGPRSVCRGNQMKLEALYKSGKTAGIGPQFQNAIESCEKQGERSYANLIRAYMARLHLTQGRYDDAVRILNDHYDEVAQARYPRLISQYDALLAQAYRQVGDSVRAKQFALRAIEHGTGNEYTEARVIAYQLLYVLAKERGEVKSALEYHEKYAAFDKGYLDDTGARQLAYQRVKHEVDANKLQIDTLNKANQVLQLQSELSDKAVENIRLYIVLLTVVLAFIGLWAYRTKRSQLHFMKLSRRDGLTGVFNRPHFIELANQTLMHSQLERQEACVVVCDLDHFKRINDTFGHAAGDAVLRQVSACFYDYLRKEDIVGRLGGEEFGFVLVNCDANIAHERCEKLREALTKVVIPNGSLEFTPSASFGISATIVSGYELRQLLADADAALYQAKRSGRNRVMQHRQTRIADAPQIDAKKQDIVATVPGIS